MVQRNTLALMPADDVITTAEACDLLEVDRSTLTRWVQGGRIAPARKLPGIRGAYLFRRADVERLRLRLEREAAVRS